MMRKTKLLTLVTGVVFAGSINTSLAGNTFSMEGTIENKDSSEMMPVDDMHIILKSNNAGTISLKDQSNPLHGATGTCSGTMLIAKGQLSGGGYCTYKDSDGDSTIVSFTAAAMDEKGSNMGSWEMIGGTGKYANASGSGQYHSVPNADRTASVNTISGELKQN